MVVANFISASKNLKRFVFEINGLSGGYIAGEIKSIGHALVAHHDTLEEIVLAVSNAHVLCPLWVMGNLKECTSLKRLAISVHTKFGDCGGGIGFETYQLFHQYLPPQLEQLQIQFPRIYAVEQITTQMLRRAVNEAPISYAAGLTGMRELSRNKEAQVPGLKRVIWWVQDTAQDPSNDTGSPAHASIHHMTELANAFENVRVKFEWITAQYFKDTPCGKAVYEW